MNHSPINVGIDTSKDQLDIGIIPSNQFFSVSNDDNGIASAIEKLLLINPDRVLIEATGRLELPFAIAAYTGVRGQLAAIDGKQVSANQAFLTC